MMNLTELKKYPMAEAIYIKAFDISKEDLADKAMEDVIADYAHLNENVEEALSTLQTREAGILRLALDKKLPLRAVGEEFNVSPERARQILNKAFRKLRHPSRARIVGGTLRLRRIEDKAKQEREDKVKRRWLEIGTEIEEQKARQQGKAKAYRISDFSLSQACQEKLHALGVDTATELLAKFPYNTQTNGLTGLAIADGIEKTDYHEIWGMLYTAEMLVHIPELPDFEALRAAERAEMMRISVPTGLSDIFFKDLELSVRTYNGLVRAGIKNVGMLLDKLGLSPSEFLTMSRDEQVLAMNELRIRNFGRKSAEEIVGHLRDVLQEYVSN